MQYWPMTRGRTAKPATPAKDKKPAAKDKAKAKDKKPATPAKGGKVHTVAKGDTPAGIAKRYGIPVKDLMKMNGISEAGAKNLKIGTKLKVSK